MKGVTQSYQYANFIKLALKCSKLKKIDLTSDKFDLIVLKFLMFFNLIKQDEIHVL